MSGPERLDDAERAELWRVAFEGVSPVGGFSDARSPLERAVERIVAQHVARAVAEAGERLAQAYDDGYNDAATMARCYGHTDHWPSEEEPRNPYRADREGQS